MSNDRKLPDGWRVLRFAEIAENINERVDDPSSSELDYYIGLEHLDPDTLKISRWGSPSDVEATKLRFYPGDVIYARRRAYQRKLGVAEWDGIASAHALVLRARPDVCLPGFLPYFLQSDQFHQRALDISVGSLSPTINWKTLAIQEFALPPVGDQADVVAVLVELDRHGEALALAATRVAALYDAIGVSMTSSPTEWQPLGNALTHLIDHRGKTPKKLGSDFVVDGVPVISGASVKGGYLDFADVRYVQPDVWRRWMTVPLAEGDIILTSEAPLGQTAWVESDEPLCLGQRLFALRPNQTVLDRHCLRAFIDSSAGQAALLRRASGSTVSGIRASELEQVLVPIPCEAEQEQLSRSIAATWQVMRSVQSIRDNLSNARRLLINHLTGPR